MRNLLLYDPDSRWYTNIERKFKLAIKLFTVEAIFFVLLCSFSVSAIFWQRWLERTQACTKIITIITVPIIKCLSLSHSLSHSGTKRNSSVLIPFHSSLINTIKTSSNEPGKLSSRVGGREEINWWRLSIPLSTPALWPPPALRHLAPSSPPLSPCF